MSGKEAVLAWDTIETAVLCMVWSGMCGFLYTYPSSVISSRYSRHCRYWRPFSQAEIADPEKVFKLQQDGICKGDNVGRIEACS